MVWPLWPVESESSPQPSVLLLLPGLRAGEPSLCLTGLRALLEATTLGQFAQVQDEPSPL